MGSRRTFREWRMGLWLSWLLWKAARPRRGQGE